jgi:hypothetical protein
LPSAGGGGVVAKFEELRGLRGDGGLSAAAVVADGFISSAVEHHRHHAELGVPQNNMVSYTHDVNNGGDEADGDGSVKTKLLQVIGSIAARFATRDDLDPDPDYRKKWPVSLCNCVGSCQLQYVQEVRSLFQRHEVYAPQI